MYPNYFFKVPTYQPTNNNFMPAIKEEPQYGESSRADTTTSSNNNNGLLEFGAITPPIQDDINYTQGYLKTQIGELVKIDFLIGSNLFIDKEGILRDVGISYVVLEEANGDMVMGDIYSIKFVTTPNGENS